MDPRDDPSKPVEGRRPVQRTGVVARGGAESRRDMRTSKLVIGIVAAGIAALAMGASEASAHGRVFIGIGPYWGWGYAAPYGYPYPYPYPYRYGYPYGYPGVTVVEQPRTYTQQPAAQETPPPAAQAPAPAPSEGPYWYYCPSSRDYYPNAPSCSEPWVRVPARSQ